MDVTDKEYINKLIENDKKLREYRKIYYKKYYQLHKKTEVIGAGRPRKLTDEERIEHIKQSKRNYAIKHKLEKI